MGHIDWNGVATVIGAIGAFIVLVGNFAMTVATYVNQWHEHRANIMRDIAASGRDAKLDDIGHKVNGLNDHIAEAARLKGIQEGIEQERQRSAAEAAKNGQSSQVSG